MLGFVRNVKFVVGNVTTAAVKNGGFGVGEVEGVYALAQCWKTLGTGGCRACLEKAAMAVGKCGPKREGRAMNAGCYLRYSTEKFYNDEQESRNSGSKSVLFFHPKMKVHKLIRIRNLRVIGVKFCSWISKFSGHISGEIIWKNQAASLNLLNNWNLI